MTEKSHQASPAASMGGWSLLRSLSYWRQSIIFSRSSGKWWATRI